MENADTLVTTIDSAEGERALGVSRFRHPRDDRAARVYGRRILRLGDALRRSPAKTVPHDVLDLWRAGAVLDLVAGPESRGNYNAWYHAADQRQVQLADLTVAEVRAMQKRLVRVNGGSAVGRYQIIDDTLDGLVARMGLSGKERFTPTLQDGMAMHMAREAGLDAWLAGAPLSEEIFRLNLSYLMLAQRLLAQDEERAAIALGVREPLMSWLRDASPSAVATLARSPVAAHELRLPRKAADNVLAACNDGRWLGPVHVAMAAVEVTRACSR